MQSTPETAAAARVARTETLANVYATLKNRVPEIEKRTIQLENELSSYLTAFSSKFDTPPVWENKQIEQDALELIFRNNLIAELFSSPEYSDIVAKEKVLRGSCSLGLGICVDGRLIIPFIGGRIAKVWESKAGEIVIVDSPLRVGEKTIESSTLASAVVERAKDQAEGKSDELLEILFAHKSSHDPEEHSCGAMKEKEARGLIPEGSDRVLENLKIHEESAETLTRVYNEAATSVGKKPLSTVAITAVYDTDHMGVILDYKGKNELSTTRITKALIEAGGIKNHVPKSHMNNFTTVEDTINLEKDIYLLTNDLLKNHEFISTINNHVEVNKKLQNLTSKQKKALKFFLARTVAFQYLSGTYDETQVKDINSHFNHEEIAQSVSRDGLNVGQFDPESQVFAASSESGNALADHILTQYQLMRGRNKVQKPYIVFVSKAVEENQTEAGWERTIGINRGLWLQLLRHPEINPLVKNGELLPIPVLLTDKKREIVRIPNHIL